MPRIGLADDASLAMFRDPARENADVEQLKAVSILNRPGSRVEVKIRVHPEQAQGEARVAKRARLS